MNLQAKVLLPILGLIIFLMGASGTVSYITAKDALTAALVDNMRGEAMGIERTLATITRNSVLGVERTAIRANVISFFKEDITDPAAQKQLSANLQQVMDTYPDFDRMTIYNLDGIAVACSDYKVVGQSFADREYFKEVKSTKKSFVSTPFLSRVTNSSVIVTATPVMIDGRMVGILTGNLDLRQFFNDSVAPIQVGSKGYAFILTADGLILLHSNTEWELNPNLPDAAVYKSLVQKGNGFHSFEDSGGTTVMAYLRKDPKSGMFAAVRADEDDVFSSLTALRNRSLMASVAGMALGLLITFMVVRPVTGAIRQSAAFAKDVAEGKLDSALAIKRKDEIGALAGALSAIPAVLKKITGAYEQLEKDVEAGRLDAQGDASAFSGEFADLIKGTNAIMARYRMVLDNIPSPVVMFSAEGRATFLNACGQQLVGRDYKGKTSAELDSRDDGNTPDCALRRSLQSGRPASAETMSYPGGKALEIAYSCIPMPDASGKVAAVLQLVTDLTQIKAAQRTMHEVAAKAMDISNHVAAATEELAAQVEEVSRGAEQQRERVGATATAMEEMNGTVIEVARNAGQAREQAEGTRKKADEGSELVKQVIEAISHVNKVALAIQQDMQNLGTQAEAIGGIMNVISDIADQTNLLALNAAIEAARAGEAGRGFAVVADEVRKLAEKTMSATSEVGSSIKGIQTSTASNIARVDQAAEGVAKATDLAAVSGKALGEILGLVNNNAALIAGIATAAEQQSSTSEEINRAVEEIHRIADETAAGMVQSSSAVQVIAGMSQDLNTLLERLRS